MASRKKVQNTHISAQLRALHAALLDIVVAMNRPQRDQMLIEAAGISLDRALFPLLVGIERFGPIGVVDMADRVGRDYTTVSRQGGQAGEASASWNGAAAPPTGACARPSSARRARR